MILIRPYCIYDESRVEPLSPIHQVQLTLQPCNQKGKTRSE